MTPPALRPENRQRSGSDGDGAAWADTVPLCFRSEAFAEDLAATDGAAGVGRRRAVVWLDTVLPPSLAIMLSALFAGFSR